MATKKKANKFLTDVDLCNNQIKNATWEHWTESVLPTENLFEGRMLFLEKDIPTTVEGKAYTYEAGSVIICHQIDGEFYFLKQLSSLQTEDVTGAIKELWRSKAGIIRGYATKAALDAALGESKTPVVYESDIGIVTADETKDQATTMYMAAKNGGSWEGKVADKWDFISVVGKDWQPALDKKFNCVTSTETGGASFSVPYGVDVSGGLPLDAEGLNNLKLKTIWLDNRTNRVDTYTIPAEYKLAPIFNPAKPNEILIAGLYGKTAAEKKVDVFQGTANKYKVLAVGENGIVKPSDISGYITYEGRDGVKTEPKSSTDPSQGTWIEADWTKVAKKFPQTSPAADKIYRMPYFFEQEVQSDKVKVTAKTIKLDNESFEREEFYLNVASADIANNKAGLYNKTLADAKMNVSTDMVIKTISSTVVADKITLKSDRRSLDLTTTTDSENLDIPAMDGTNAGLYTKKLADKKLDLPGKAPGTDQPLRLPYFFEQSVDRDKVTVTAHTVKLDNTENKVDEKFTMVVLPADITGDKAGLYTKDLADVKADKTYVDDELAKKLNLPGKAPGTEQPLRLPYYFDKTGDDKKVTVTAHTVKLNNDPQPQTPEYFTMVVESATPNTSATVTDGKAGLMSAADKYKLDTMIKDDSEDEEHVLSSKMTMEKIREFGSKFVGAYETHNAMIGQTKTSDIDINDYCTVLDDTYTEGGVTKHDKECWRYRCKGWNEGTGHYDWAEEYPILNVPLTPKQWNAINSYEIEETNGKSYISNLKGDAGALLKFVHTDGTRSAIAVNDGGSTGIAAQIYALDGTTGTRINVTKNKIYYTKRSDATYADENEIATIGDISSGGKSKFIELLGKVQGTDQPYRLPYFFETDVQPEYVKVKAHTITLDNMKVTDTTSYFIDVAKCDLTNNKAGLYTKSIDDTLIHTTNELTSTEIDEIIGAW